MEKKWSRSMPDRMTGEMCCQTTTTYHLRFIQCLEKGLKSKLILLFYYFIWIDIQHAKSNMTAQHKDNT